jgi:hypothetical protein
LEPARTPPPEERENRRDARAGLGNSRGGDVDAGWAGKKREPGLLRGSYAKMGMVTPSVVSLPAAVGGLIKVPQPPTAGGIEEPPAHGRGADAGA